MTFTESYIALCREHPLEPGREFAVGDYYNHAGTSPTVEDPNNVALVALAAFPNRPPGVWVPRLDQLLDLLEAAGYPGVEFWTDHLGARVANAQAPTLRRSVMSGEGSSREEAAYRLLLAVREG